jgi:hypothetical protein
MGVHRRRRARPRKIGQRYSNGRLVPSKVADRGTPELREKRRQLVGDPDERRASSLLGVLTARGLIEPDEYEAAERYAELYLYAARPHTGFVLAQPVAAALLLKKEIALKRAFPGPIIGNLKYRLAFNKARLSIVRQSGTRAAAIVDSFVIFDRTLGPSLNLRSLRNGLDALRRYFAGVDRGYQGGRPRSSEVQPPMV